MRLAAALTAALVLAIVGHTEAVEADSLDPIVTLTNDGGSADLLKRSNQYNPGNQPAKGRPLEQYVDGDNDNSSGYEGPVPCFGSVVSGDAAASFMVDVGRSADEVQPGDQWVIVTCSFGTDGAAGGVGASAITDVYRLADPANPGAPGTGPNITQLVQRAKETLRVPAPIPTLSPGIDVPHLVGIPEYLAIDPAEWRPWEVTASVPGASLTLTATPTDLRWDMGNGDTVTCDGPGEAWTDGDAEPDCGYTYQWSSTATQPDGTYHVTVSTIWTRTWTCTPGCGSGTLPNLARPTTFDLEVRQAQALITR